MYLLETTSIGCECNDQAIARCMNERSLGCKRSKLCQRTITIKFIIRVVSGANSALSFYFLAPPCRAYSVQGSGLIGVTNKFIVIFYVKIFADYTFYLNLGSIVRNLG